MFRTQEHVPEIYPNKSRDFQMLCRCKDLIFNATKYSIDSILHTSNSKEIDSRLLPLLLHKLGIFKSSNLSESTCRFLASCFPYIIKYKGSLIGIKYSIYAWFRLEAAIQSKLIKVIIDKDHSDIQIYVSEQLSAVDFLESIFEYVLPAGYSYKIDVVYSEFPHTSLDFISNNYKVVVIDNYYNSKSKIDEFKNNEFIYRNTQTVGLAETYLEEETSKTTMYYDNEQRN